MDNLDLFIFKGYVSFRETNDDYILMICELLVACHDFFLSQGFNKSL